MECDCLFLLSSAIVIDLLHTCSCTSCQTSARIVGADRSKIVNQIARLVTRFYIVILEIKLDVVVFAAGRAPQVEFVQIQLLSIVSHYLIIKNINIFKLLSKLKKTNE